MSLFHREPKSDAPKKEVTVLFELDKEFDKRLFTKSKGVSISIDGNPFIILMPGESYEFKTFDGKHKFKFSSKLGTTYTTKNITGNTFCYLEEDNKEELRIRWS